MLSPSPLEIACHPEKRNRVELDSSQSSSPEEGHGWAVSRSFEASWIHFAVAHGTVTFTHNLASDSTSDKIIVRQQKVSSRLVQFTRSSKELCAVGTSGSSPEYVVLVGIKHVNYHFATLGRPLAGYQSFCRLLYHAREQQTDMVADMPRTSFLHKAISRHCGGKRVLEIGVGSGVLLAFAAKAGAACVNGVEGVPEAAALARETISCNGLEEAVELHEAMIENFKSTEQWDVVVSECLGLMGISEWMVMSMLVGRRWLSEAGTLLPSSITLFACPVRACFAHMPGGVNMAHIVPPVLLPLRVPPEALMSHDCEGLPIYELDLATVGPSDLSSRADIEFTPKEDCRLTALCIWFDIKCSSGCCCLSTAPSAPVTHWQQTLLSFYPKVLEAQTGVPLKLQIDVYPSPVELEPDSDHAEPTPLLTVGVCMRVLDASIVADRQPFEASWNVPVTDVVIETISGV